MNLTHLIFGERSLTKVAAIFDSRVLAETTALRLRQASGMTDAQVKLVGPEDEMGVVEAPLSRKLEPESSGIWHTMIRAHVVTGVMGVAAGGLFYLGLRMLGNVAIVSNPIISLVVTLFFGGIFGLLFGGLLTLRPDHYRVMASVRKAIKRGRWAVVSHPVNHDQTEQVMSLLNKQHVNTVRSF